MSPFFTTIPASGGTVSGGSCANAAPVPIASAADEIAATARTRQTGRETWYVTGPPYLMMGTSSNGGTPGIVTVTFSTSTGGAGNFAHALSDCPGASVKPCQSPCLLASG